MKGREHAALGEGPFSVKQFLSLRVPHPETYTSISSSLNLAESGRQMGATNYARAPSMTHISIIKGYAIIFPMPIPHKNSLQMGFLINTIDIYTI